MHGDSDRGREALTFKESNRKLGVCGAQGYAWRMGEPQRHEAQIYQESGPFQVLRGNANGFVSGPEFGTT